MSRSDPQQLDVYKAEAVHKEVWKKHLLLDLHPGWATRYVMPGQTGSGFRRGDVSTETWQRWQRNRAYRATIAARIQSLADAVVAHPNWVAMRGPNPVKATLAARNATSSYGGLYAAGWRINIQVRAATPLTIAHELAHVSAIYRLGVLGAGGDEGHGPNWARDALVLYGTLYGHKGRDAMAKTYTACGVRFEPFDAFPVDHLFHDWALANIGDQQWLASAGFQPPTIHAAALRAASPN